MSEQQEFRELVRRLKRLIHENPAVRARFDLDGDGEISSDEWERAVDHLRRELERRPARPPVVTRATFEKVEASPAPADRRPSLTSCGEIKVRQSVEIHEAVFGFETCNRYVFIDPATGAELGGADEASGGLGGFLCRQFLGPARPLKLAVTGNSQGIWMEGSRPFSIIAIVRPPTMTINWNEGVLGRIRRVWPLLIRRRYELSLGDQRPPDLHIDGTLLHPWTFPVKKRGRQVACVYKKWSGIGREVFTDADNFLVRFEESDLSAQERLLILSVALAIDFDFFESKPRH